MPTRNQFSWEDDFIAALRDWFAGQALAGLYACRDLQLATLHDMAATGGGGFDLCMAKQAYAQADAMLAAREVAK